MSDNSSLCWSMELAMPRRRVSIQQRDFQMGFGTTWSCSADCVEAGSYNVGTRFHTPSRVRFAPLTPLEMPRSESWKRKLGLGDYGGGGGICLRSWSSWLDRRRTYRALGVKRYRSCSLLDNTATQLPPKFRRSTDYRISWPMHTKLKNCKGTQSRDGSNWWRWWNNAMRNLLEFENYGLFKY